MWLDKDERGTVYDSVKRNKPKAETVVLRAGSKNWQTKQLKGTQKLELGAFKNK